MGFVFTENKGANNM